MTRPASARYVAECFWSGVSEDDLPVLDRRIGACVTEHGDAVRYFGSMLIVDDEVVLCLFEGPAAAVRRVAEAAGLPFERILRGTGSPWTRADPSPGKENSP
jgi:hypothetical protein